MPPLLCQRCGDPLCRHLRGVVCEVCGTCRRPGYATPVPPRAAATPQDQRERDLAEPLARLVRMGHSEVVPYLYAAWDSGWTARDRSGKGAT